MPASLDLYSLKGRTRQLNVSAFGEGVEDVPAQNMRGEWIVSPGQLSRTELVRLGQSWNAHIATASAFTFVAALPTTRAELVLFNGEPAGGKSYILDSAWVLGITSMAAAGSIALIGQHVPAATAPTDAGANVLTTSRIGKTYGGNAKRALAQTTMTTDKWELLNTSNNGGAATAQIGLAAWADLYGGWILRPGDMFGLNAVAGTAAGTAIAGITWHEMLLPMP